MELDLTGIHKLAAEQGIDPETLDDALAEALRLAYLKTPHAAKHARVELDERAGNFTVWAADEIPVEPTEDNPYPVPKLGEEYDDTPRDFGRLAAATARQVITQLFRRAEDEKVFGAFSGQKGKLITGIIQQDASDPSNVHVAMGDVEAILPRREQVPGERYRHGERIRVYVVNVARGIKGPEIVVSRSHPELVRKLFEREVPELVSGAVSIMAIAREAGARTKIAVKANTDGVNPKGALIGPGGARVRAVMENLGPEKIDIVISGNIIKNVKSVIVPNTGGLKGITAAIAAGVAVGNADKQLEVLADVKQEDIPKIAEFMNSCQMTVMKSQSDKLLDIDLHLYAGSDSVRLRITDLHTNIVLIEKNGNVLFEASSAASDGGETDRSVLNVQDIVDFAETVDIDDVRELLEKQIGYNLAISEVCCFPSGTVFRIIFLCINLVALFIYFYMSVKFPHGSHSYGLKRCL